jgi:hypothetical protein
MNFATVKRTALTSRDSLGITEQVEMTGNVLSFCADQILMPTPIGSRFVNVRLLPAHSYPRRSWADGNRPSAPSLYSVASL